ncbi:MAG: glycoside hydrolase family 32 protein [Bacilli bacterium]|nr:glycoside hydrolase family 32 protein [Bacilli bacterium]
MDYKLHYHPAKNWINDPNGLCFFNGQFHIYYQYNPKGTKWGNICWGHCTTTNFINYKEENMALLNDTPYDCEGVFSGNGIVIDKTLYVYYTSIAPAHPTQSVAKSKDGYNFEKYQGNPIIDTHSEARDPFVFYYNDELYMIIGTQDKVLLYKGVDPFHFNYLSDLINGNEFYECPNLVKIGDKYLFKYSSMIDRCDHFNLGSFDGAKFIKEKEVKLPLPKNYYAAQIFNHEGKLIMIGWIANPDYDGMLPFNGLLSIPRELYLENGDLKSKPLEAFEKYLVGNKIIDNDIIEEF